MEDPTEPKWVLPANLPFADLKGRDLEECLYWLLDAMGARDLEWRIGGAAGGAADGGRDIEGYFYSSDSGEEIKRRRWWIECKGRAGTVEPEQVKNAANNAQAQADLDVLVIATNTTFSNPTRDWVKQWQMRFPKPKIELWDAVTLERLLSEQPTAVLRLFSEALSLDGQLEALRERFWTKLEYGNVQILKDAWDARAELTLDGFKVAALIANEFDHGDIESRPWGGALDFGAVLDALNTLNANVMYIFLRCLKLNAKQEPLFKTFAYLVMCTIRALDTEELADVLMASINAEKHPDPNAIFDVLLGPLVGAIQDELQTACATGCPRFPSFSRRRDEERPEGSYWYRFGKRGLAPREERKERLLLQSTKERCQIGLDLTEWDNSCPLFHINANAANLREFLKVVDRVLTARLGPITNSVL